METFYNRVIFDVTQLILNKQYKRAVTLGQFLINKGFRTGQLIVTISYAQKILYGPQQAIEYIKKFTQSRQNNGSCDQSQKIISPLIKLALTQYNLQSQKRSQAFQNIQQLMNLTQKITQTNMHQNRLCEIIKKLLQSHQQDEENCDLNLKNLKGQDPKLDSTEVQEIIKQINQLTLMYQEDKKNIKPQNNLQILIPESRYAHYLNQYDEIRKRIFTIIAELIERESQLMKNQKIKKRPNKFIKDKQENKSTKDKEDKKLHKEDNKLIKQIKSSLNSNADKKMTQKLDENITSFERFQQRLYTQQQNDQKQKIRQFIIPTTQVEKLQSLILHINGFVAYFRRKIKESQNQRLKQIQKQNLSDSEI